jgi:glucokinase
MFLAGDVGGTKTVLALYERAGAARRLVREATFPSHEFPDLESVIRRFIDTDPPGPIASACFGVAGAVLNGRSSATNLPWVLDEHTLAAAIPAGRVKLINDLEATAWGVMTLEPDERVTLQTGTSRDGHMAVIAAGTGLGEALIPWDGTRHWVMASEGGHADFAPRTERQMALLRWVARECDHVSYERVLSGPGLFTIYRFLTDGEGAPRPGWLADRLAREDPSAVVSEVGLAREDAACVEALDLFVAIYGAEAGNLALKGLALGGVWIAGGIAPRLRAKLEDGTFLEAFRDKGRFVPLMRTIPVHLVLNPRAPLLGAAHVAAIIETAGG